MLLELATAANFNEERYLRANPDVAAYVDAGGDALEHLLQHGIEEGRHQVVEHPSAVATLQEEPDHLIPRLLGEFTNSLPAELRERFKSLNVGNLIAMPPGSPFWRECLKAVSQSSR